MGQTSDRIQPAFRVGVALFNAGEFFEQHEILEELWRAEPGPIRELYQGILQVGVGFHHLERGNHHGAVTLLGRGIARLERAPTELRWIDVAALINQSRWCLGELERLGPGRLDQFPRTRIPKIAWLVDQNH